MKIDFVVKRLLRMSAPEIIHRIKTHVQATTDRTKAGTPFFGSETNEKTDSLFANTCSLPLDQQCIAEATMICNNQFDVFSLKNHYVGKTIDYHKDYKSGLAAPSNVYWKDIDYRDAATLGDVKYIWELNRHLFLTKLALAYHMTGDLVYVQKCEELLNEWIEQNPFMMGINWTSALEMSIRLINWTISIHLIGDKLQETTRSRWLQAVYQHCWYINRYFSGFSSANNHLIGEAAGLFIASSALPKFEESQEWQKRSFEILVQEASKQTHEDGVNKEQALSYQQFVFDFLLLAALVGNRYGKGFPERYWKTMESMCDFLAALENMAGVFPQIGDEDDGYVVDVGQRRVGVYRSILNTASIFFNREKFGCKNLKKDLKTALLMNMAGIEEHSLKLGNAKPMRESFEQGGYYVLNRNPGSDHEQKLIFDCGPLGYLSLAAHGHADALSFFFSAGGSPIFIDPGTYAYHAHKKWRNYFRSTKAHNTVCVDNEDQSVMAGNFMWSHKATATLLAYEKGVYVKGKQDGYSRFGKKGVIHQREVIYDEPANQWKITDELTGKGQHTIDICFHLDRSCRIHSQGENHVDIQFPKGICRLVYERGMDCNLYYGDDTLPLGWQSPAYDMKEPTHTLILSKTIEGNERIQTTFQAEFTQDR